MLALRAKQIQQNYRPIIAVHKWFARHPRTLFRGLVLADFSDQRAAGTFSRANDFHGRVVADPFMGGGTPLLEANRVGCNVLGFDIKPKSVMALALNSTGIQLWMEDHETCGDGSIDRQGTLFG